MILLYQKSSTKNTVLFLWYYIFMYNRLPKELIIYIYSFDSTYRSIYNQCIQELHYIWKQQYLEFILWRSHCC